MDEVTEVLIKAKEILESEVDWCQTVLWVLDDGSFQISDYGVDESRVVSACAAGAIRLAAIKLYGKGRDSLDQTYEAEMRLAAIVSADVLDFNDLPSTSKEDVLLAFKRAIENV